ncbi:hypothetical protein NL676_027364 [Syzygium grande]|nr:hypothetical protein NL676_027364 [Syzygium grande]
MAEEAQNGKKKKVSEEDVHTSEKALGVIGSQHCSEGVTATRCFKWYPALLSNHPYANTRDGLISSLGFLSGMVHDICFRCSSSNATSNSGDTPSPPLAIVFSNAASGCNERSLLYVAAT